MNARLARAHVPERTAHMCDCMPLAVNKCACEAVLAGVLYAHLHMHSCQPPVVVPWTTTHCVQQGMYSNEVCSCAWCSRSRAVCWAGWLCAVWRLGLRGPCATLPWVRNQVCCARSTFSRPPRSAFTGLRQCHTPSQRACTAPAPQRMSSTKKHMASRNHCPRKPR